MNGDWQSKDIYLKHEKEKVFIGLHSTGDYSPDGQWMSLEAWMNLYNPDKSFLCSQSRIFGPIEEVAEELKKEGWTVIGDWNNEVPKV